MTDRETIREHLRLAREEGAEAYRRIKAELEAGTSGPTEVMCIALGRAHRQREFPDELMAFIDSLPPAEDEKLVQLARDVKRWWARAADSERAIMRDHQGSRYMAGRLEAMRQQGFVCQWLLERISELRGETDAKG